LQIFCESVSGLFQSGLSLLCFFSDGPIFVCSFFSRLNDCSCPDDILYLICSCSSSCFLFLQKKNFSAERMLLLLLVAACCGVPLRDYVLPLVGSGGQGFGAASVPPGAQLPFSSLRLSPDTSHHLIPWTSFEHFGG
jgi:hypothetical protein